MKKQLKKTCIVCKDEFTPDPRVGDRQKVCKKYNCKLQRKRLAQKRWCANNPDYFQGRYASLKDQILANQQNTCSKKVDPRIILQDEIISCFKSVLRAISLASLQDELTCKITRANRENRQTIQDEINYNLYYG
jgi:hypothetical protein